VQDLECGVAPQISVGECHRNLCRHHDTLYVFQVSGKVLRNEIELRWSLCGPKEHQRCLAVQNRHGLTVDLFGSTSNFA
jgi:hypothetical protein